MLSSQFNLTKRESIRVGEKGSRSVLIYGFSCYLIFVATFLYLIAFIGNLIISQSLDAPARVPFAQALVTDIGLIAPFGVQHSLMA